MPGLQYLCREQLLVMPVKAMMPMKAMMPVIGVSIMAGMAVIGMSIVSKAAQAPAKGLVGGTGHQRIRSLIDLISQDRERKGGDKHARTHDRYRKRQRPDDQGIGNHRTRVRIMVAAVGIMPAIIIRLGCIGIGPQCGVAPVFFHLDIRHVVAD